jgi:hypothetical protein
VTLAIIVLHTFGSPAAVLGATYYVDANHPAAHDGNRVAQVYLSGKNAPRTKLVEDLFSDNILFATSASQRTLHVALNYDDVHFGGSDGNYFCNPHASQHIHVSRYVPGPGGTVAVVQEDMTLAGWRTLAGHDGNSKEFGHLDRIAGMTIPRPVKPRVLCNVTRNATAVDLGASTYCDVEGNKVHGTVVLWPFESKILIPAHHSIPAAP